MQQKMQNQIISTSKMPDNINDIQQFNLLQNKIQKRLCIYLAFLSHQSHFSGLQSYEI